MLGNHHADGRLEPSVACPDLGVGACISEAMQFNGNRISTGDILFLQREAFLVRGCAQIDGKFAIISQRCTLVDRVTSLASRYTCSEELGVQTLPQSILFATNWAFDELGAVIVEP